MQTRIAVVFISLAILLLGWANAGRGVAATRDAVPEINESGWKFLSWGMTFIEVSQELALQNFNLGEPRAPGIMLVGFEPDWKPLELAPGARLASEAGGDIVAVPTDFLDAELLFSNSRLFGVRLVKHTPQHIQDKLFNAMRRRYPDAVSFSAGPGRYRFLNSSLHRTIVWDAMPTGFTLCFYDSGVLAGLRGEEPQELTTGAQREPVTELPAFFVEQAPSDSESEPGEYWVEPVTGMELAYIQGGCEDRDTGERRCVDPFWMSVFETTNAQMRIFDPNHHSGEPGGALDSDSMPAVGVSKERVREFAAWLGRRSQSLEFALPSEVEWEYAARSGMERGMDTPWGTPEMACEYANVANREDGSDAPGFPCLDGFSGASPVGMFTPGVTGLYDILGNAWEMCEAGGPGMAGRDSEVVARGGGWDSAPGRVGISARSESADNGEGQSVGFRLIMRRMITPKPVEQRRIMVVPESGQEPRGLGSSPGSRPALEGGIGGVDP